MEIIEKINIIKKSIEETDRLVDLLISNLELQKLNANNNENKIIQLKEEVRLNVEKIDEIIEDYNANI